MAAFINEMGRMGKIVARRALGQGTVVDVSQDIADQISKISPEEIMQIAYEISDMRSATEAAYRALDSMLSAIATIHNTNFDESLQYLRENMGISGASAIMSYADEFVELSKFMRQNYSIDEFHDLPPEDQIIVAYAFWGTGPFGGSTKGLRFLPEMSGGNMGIVIHVATLIIIMGAAFLVGLGTGVITEGLFDITGTIGLFKKKYKEYIANLECTIKKLEKERQDLINDLEEKTVELVEKGEMTQDAANEVKKTVTHHLDDMEDTIKNNLQPTIDDMKNDLGFVERIEVGFKKVECIAGKVGYYAVLGGAGILAFKVGSAVLDMIRKK